MVILKHFDDKRVDLDDKEKLTEEVSARVSLCVVRVCLRVCVCVRVRLLVSVCVYARARAHVLLRHPLAA